jgi:hypothetical protein
MWLTQSRVAEQYAIRAAVQSVFTQSRLNPVVRREMLAGV